MQNVFIIKELGIECVIAGNFSSVLQYFLVFTFVDGNANMTWVTNEVSFEYLRLMLLYVGYHS